MSWIGSDAEAARYAIATRVAGPVLIALGSLNNSLFVNQVAQGRDLSRIARITGPAARRLGAITVVITPLLVAGVLLLGMFSASIADRHLVVPTLLLLLACVPFAVAIPWGFAFNAVGEEPRWMQVLLFGIALNAVLVVAFGRWGATWTAAAWLVTQSAVLGATMVQRRRVGLLVD
jgi:O-antigen/teichoic acid export membrane protein